MFAVPQAEEDVCFVSGEINRAAALVRLTVELSIAPEGDGAVGGISESEMDRPAGGVGILRSAGGTGALEVVAAGQPLPLILFGKDNGIEDAAVRRLDGHHAAAGLI